MRCDAMPQSAHHISALALLGAAIRASGMEQIVTLPREVKDSQVDQTPTQAHPADGGIMGGEDALGRTGSTPLYLPVVPEKAPESLR